MASLTSSSRAIAAVDSLDTRRVKRKPNFMKTDKVMAEMEKEISILDKKLGQLRWKAEKRGKRILQKHFELAVSTEKWVIDNIELFQGEDYFEIVASKWYPPVPLNATLKLKAIPGNNNALKAIDAMKPERKKRLPKAILSYDDFMRYCDSYGSRSFMIDDCEVYANYNALRFSSGKGRKSVFDAIKSLKLKLEMASFLKAIESGEAVIASKKDLVKTLVDNMLFAI